MRDGVKTKGMMRSGSGLFLEWIWSGGGAIYIYIYISGISLNWSGGSKRPCGSKKVVQLSGWFSGLGFCI